MKFGKWEFPDGLLYDTHNQWAAVDGNKIRFGLTTFGLEVTGEVLYLSIPEVGTAVDYNTGCGSLESGKWVGRLYTPVEGRITAVNEAVIKNPRLVNEAPYEHWLAEISFDDQSQLADLMTTSSLTIWLTEESRENA